MNIRLLYKIKNGPTPNPDPIISANIFLKYWKLPIKKSIFRGKNYKRYLDIGVIVENVNNDIEDIAICLPFKTKPENILNLSQCLEKENIVSHILKKRYRCTTLDDCPTYHYLQEITSLSGEGKNLCLYEVCENSKEIVDLNEGSMLLIKIQSYPKNIKEIKEKPSEDTNIDARYNLFIQLRIVSLSESDISHIEDISNDLVQSAFSKSEMIDIRFNDLINIDHDDYQTLEKEHSLLLPTSIKFSFIGSSKDETIIGNKPYDDCELLDSKYWKDYMTGISSNDVKCISYNWNVDVATKKLFFKTVYSSHHWTKILKYSAYVILLSFIASGILELVKYLLT